MADTPAELKLTLRCSGMCLVHCHDTDAGAWRDEKTLMLALSDPGHFTPRENRWPDADESLTHWQMRAIRIIFQAREDELAMHDRLIAVARADENESCALLAEQLGVRYVAHQGLITFNLPFADLIRDRATP